PLVGTNDWVAAEDSFRNVFCRRSHRCCSGARSAGGTKGWFKNDAAVMTCIGIAPSDSIARPSRRLATKSIPSVVDFGSRHPPVQNARISRHGAGSEGDGLGNTG